MFKKHKYKFLIALVLFVAIGGATAYYFKKKAADEKADKMNKKDAQKEEKEPLEVPKVVKKPTEKQATEMKTKELTISKGDKELLTKKKK